MDAIVKMKIFYLDIVDKKGVTARINYQVLGSYF